MPQTQKIPLSVNMSKSNAVSSLMSNGCNNCKRASLLPKGPSRKMRKLGSFDPQVVKLVECVKRAAQKTKLNKQKSTQANDRSSSSTSDINIEQTPSREDENSNPQMGHLLTPRLTSDSEHVRPTPSERTEVGASPDDVINRSRRRRMLYADTGRPRPFYRRSTSSGIWPRYKQFYQFC